MSNLLESCPNQQSTGNMIALNSLLATLTGLNASSLLRDLQRNTLPAKLEQW